MNKTAIKNFAVWARRKLISDITYKAGLLGISDKGISDPLPISTDNIQFFDIGTGKPTEIANEEIKQRKALVARIREKESTADYKKAYQYVVEEVAYTWFNRLIAIRFMEVNDYMPSRVRVLSSHIQGKSEPDIVTTPFDTDIEFSAYEQDRIMQLKDENKLDELFRMLFIKQCNKLNEVLPGLFEKTADYTELLLNISFTDQEGLVNHLINDIAEEDFTEAVEIIGWLYQYYNSELKDEVFALLKNKVKITKDHVPAATQLFTPDWIVRYMVENSVGKLWVEDQCYDNINSKWKYFVNQNKQIDRGTNSTSDASKKRASISPEQLKIIDPCMGSGHVLVYAFEILMDIYESNGFMRKDAAYSIVKNNLYGLDIDNRAYQLTYFAIMMKARKYDRRFFNRKIQPNVFSIQESNGLKKKELSYFGKSMNSQERIMAEQEIKYIIDSFEDAKEYGSALKIEKCSWKLLKEFLLDISMENQISFDMIDMESVQCKLLKLVRIAEIISDKYNAVITNPPYMGNNGMNSKLSKYVKEQYPASKTDLFSVFIEKCNELTETNGYYAMITQPSLLALSSFERLRNEIFKTNTIESLIHMGRGIFGIDFGSIAFVIKKANLPELNSSYFRLHNKTFQYIDPSDIETLFLLANQDHNCSFDFEKYDTKKGIKTELLGNGIKLYYEAKQADFVHIPGMPIVYWLSKTIIDSFNLPPLGEVLTTREGMATADNNRFLRNWFEVARENIGFRIKYRNRNEQNNYKWFPYNKGGDYRKWYGNNQLIVNWENDGYEIKNNIDEKTGRVRSHNYNGEYAFREGITWSSISAGDISVRLTEDGFLFDSKGAKGFCENHKELLAVQALLNSCVAKEYLRIFSPTMDFKVGDVIQIPLKREIFKDEEIINISKELSEIGKEEWNSYETSWDFERHPLVSSENRISESFNKWHLLCDGYFNRAKTLEEKLNQMIIKIYNLENELKSKVNEDQISLRKADKKQAVKSLILYAVGCIFGRYSLDQSGLVYAGGHWNSNMYSSFTPDNDNCIPITDEEYFEDDIVGRFVEFIKVVYGTDTLEENLDFIAKALGGKGDTSREIIRNYFIKDFFKDHVKTYQKRPIYWLYDSGKHNGFKALVYMHRYTADTTGIVRVDYLHKMQKIYMSEIDRMQDMIENGTHARDIAQAEKRKEKLVKQLKETKEYDEKIAHIALSRIDIDLDDGVKVNYDKVQTAQDGKKLSILAKI